MAGLSFCCVLLRGFALWIWNVLFDIPLEHAGKEWSDCEAGHGVHLDPYPFFVFYFSNHMGYMVLFKHGDDLPELLDRSSDTLSVRVNLEVQIAAIYPADTWFLPGGQFHKDLFHGVFGFVDTITHILEKAKPPRLT